MTGHGSPLGEGEFASRVRDSFTRQGAMTLIGARLDEVFPGAVTISLPFRPDLTQQHGYLHAAVITAVLDNSCGYAALSVVPTDRDVLTAEYKVNFLSPARGSTLVGRGRVVRAGKTIVVAAGDAFMEAGASGEEQLVATMLATIAVVPRKSDYVGTLRDAEGQ